MSRSDQEDWGWGVGSGGDDLRSAVLPILQAIEHQLIALRLLLGDDGQGDPAEAVAVLPGLAGLEAPRPRYPGTALDALPDKLLTPREGEVLSLLVKGASNGAIARSLAISERTVKAHLQSVFRKLKVTGRSEAIAAVLSPVDRH